MMNDVDPRQLSQDMRALARESLPFFAVRMFREMYDTRYYDNWHIWVIAHWLTRAAIGDVHRLIIAMPPRSLKSWFASVCLPAWLLGRKPSQKIVCASYGQKLAEEFGFETRKPMQTDLYRRIFPNTHLDPR